MDVPIVLWNINGTDKKDKSRLEQRVNTIVATVKSWIKKNDVPTVVLAQECKEIAKWNAWKNQSWTQHIERSTEKGVYCFAEKEKEITHVDICDLRLDGCVLRTNITREDNLQDNLLVCSWHGPWNENKIEKREKCFKEMLQLVNRIQGENNCSAVLVGGDFNLISRKAREILSGLETPNDAYLYDNYILPPGKERAIQYIIGWPKDRFLMWDCEVIMPENFKSKDLESGHTKNEDTKKEGTKCRDHKLFDHPLVKYDFIMSRQRNNVEKGEVVWKETEIGKGRCEGEHLKGYWNGVGEGECQVRGIVKIKCKPGDMKIKKDGQKVERSENKWKFESGEKIEWSGRGRVAWVGGGEVVWECTEKSEVSLYGVDQMVCEHGLAKKMSSLELDGNNPEIHLHTVDVST